MQTLPVTKTLQTPVGTLRLETDGRRLVVTNEPGKTLRIGSDSMSVRFEYLVDKSNVHRTYDIAQIGSAPAASSPKAVRVMDALINWNIGVVKDIVLTAQIEKVQTKEIERRDGVRALFAAEQHRAPYRIPTLVVDEPTPAIQP
jgi:hypothetical protein